MLVHDHPCIVCSWMPAFLTWPECRHPTPWVFDNAIPTLSHHAGAVTYLLPVTPPLLPPPSALVKGYRYHSCIVPRLCSCLCSHLKSDSISLVVSTYTTMQNESFNCYNLKIIYQLNDLKFTVSWSISFMHIVASYFNTRHF